MPMQEMQEMQVGSLSREDPERLLLNHERRCDSWLPEEKNSTEGQRGGLITQSFCVIKVLLTYKRESF